MNLALSYHLKHDLVLRALWRRARAAAVPAEINGELAIDRGLWTDRRSERRTASDADDSGVREPGDNASGPNGREVAEAKAEGGITRDLISPFENLAVRHRDFQRAVVGALADELEPWGSQAYLILNKPRSGCLGGRSDDLMSPSLSAPAGDQRADRQQQRGNARQ